MKIDQVFLRERHPDHCALGNALVRSRWSAHLEVATLQPTRRYLRIASSLGPADCEAWLDFQPVADHWMGESAIPVEQLDPELALEFARDAFDQWGIPPVLELLQWNAVEAVVCGDADIAPRYRVRDAPLALYISRLPEEPARPAPAKLPDFSLPVTLAFGPVVLPAYELASLQPGDALLLSPSACHLSVCDHRLSTLTFDGNHFVTTSLDPSADQSPTAPDPGRKMVDLSESPALSQLPVELTFVLATQRMTLSDIAALVPGCVVPLRIDRPVLQAWAGAHLLGSGELIKVGATLAVEFTQVNGAAREDAKEPATAGEPT